MFFENDEHKQNYETLMSMYKLKPTEDPYYESAIYLSSIREIFKCFNLERLDTSQCPLFHVMQFNEEEHVWNPAHPALTGTTSQLARLGVNLFTSGFPIDMTRLLDQLSNDTLFRVFVQSLKIRKGKHKLQI